jgi:hypothetical protein
VAGVWHHADVRFTASRLAAEFLYPRAGSPDVVPERPFEWTPVLGAEGYRLTVGTWPGLSDLVDLPVSARTSIRLADLPAHRQLSARILTRVGGVWRARDVDFAIGQGYEAARPLEPLPGGTADLRRPFTWARVAVAIGYRLRIGVTPGGSDLHDSGVIGVTRRFVPELPPDRRLFAVLTTMYADRSVDFPFDFRAIPGEPGEDDYVEAALGATAEVRGMAGPANTPWPRNLLARFALEDRVSTASCNEYAQALSEALSEQGNRPPTRILNVCLLGNLYDCHTLVEMLRPSRQQWMLLDPTFGVTVRRRRDGEWATAADLSAAARLEDWRGLSIVALTDESLSLLHSYYIDYPLLFVSSFGQEVPSPDGGPSILRYYQEIALPFRNRPGAYAVRCMKGSTAPVLVNGLPTEVTCSGRDGLSQVRAASSLASLPGHEGEVRAYRPRRFVF